MICNYCYDSIAPGSLCWTNDSMVVCDTCHDRRLPAPIALLMTAEDAPEEEQA